jgi:hypothetical protein
MVGALTEIVDSFLLEKGDAFVAQLYWKGSDMSETGDD